MDWVMTHGEAVAIGLGIFGAGLTVLTLLFNVVDPIPVTVRRAVLVVVLLCLASGALIYVGSSGGSISPQVASLPTLAQHIASGPTQTPMPTTTPGQPSQASARPAQGNELPQAPAASPQRVATKIVPRNSSRGVTFDAPSTGTYEFHYVSGAYSTYGSGRSPAGVGTWLASVCVFEGSAIWHGNILSTSDAMLVIGWGGRYFTNQTDSAGAAAGQVYVTELNAGNHLTLVTVDAQDAYSDNSGSDVTVDIWLLP